MSVELFNGLVSPEIAGVLDEAMREMPDSAVHVTPGRYGSGRVHVSIGGGSYDLSLTIDGGDRVASLELVPVGGRTGNAVAVLRLACETGAQHRVLGRNADRASVEMALAHHDAA